MTHSEGLSSSEKEDQRPGREGFLEEMGLELELQGKGGCETCEDVEMSAFWAEGVLGAHGTCPGLEGPGLSGVEGSEVTGL